MAPGAAPRYSGGQRQRHESRSQLPVEVTGFVGRRAELAQIAALLGSARLVTVCGPGGVGKTRVALRAAAQVAGSYTHGACLVELSGLRHPELLPNTVAGRLGLPEQDSRPALEAVLDYLRDQRLLLILDTCEHLIDACAMFAEAVLRETAAVTVLATTRQPLDVPGEHTYLVPPLPVPVLVPDGGEAPVAAAGTDAVVPPGPARAGAAAGSAAARSGDAVELFAQRAAAAVPGFRVTDANRADATRLCQRLDGIPLAIELAAVRLRALPLTELTQRLEHRFQILTRGRRGTAARHQTLRTAIDWSHGLCSPAEQELWARLSVFAASFDLDAVEEVCADPGTPRAETVQTLTGLIDKSVVLREDADSTRYRMLDTLREFGAERLAAAGDTPPGGQTAIRGRLVARYLRLAREFEEHLLEDRQMAMFHGLRAEHANIRAALEYSLDGPPGQSDRENDGADLAIRLHTYWQISGLLHEGGYWLGKVLDRFRRPSPQRAMALGVRGRLRMFSGDTEGALASIREGIAMADGLGDQRVGAIGHMYLHLALAFAGQLEEAAAESAEATRRMEQLAGRLGLIYLQPQIAYLHQLAGELDLAVECCQRGLRMFGADSKERWLHSYLHLISGFALFRQPGREAECAAEVRKALLAKHELGDSVGIAYALELLGWLAARDGRCEGAAWLLGAAEPLWARAGSRLSNTAALEEFHQDAVGRAREALGAKRYAALAAQGARQPLSLVVAEATGQAPEGAPGEEPGRGGALVTPAGLTAREREIASLITDGMSNREIAAMLFISKRTVDAHVDHIFGKLGISSRLQLTGWLRDRQSSPGDDLAEDGRTGGGLTTDAVP